MHGNWSWLRAFRAPPTHRDRPISWAVAVASFVSIFFSMGLSFGSIGAMTLAFGDMFAGRASEDDISWIGGIRLCFVFLTGFLSSMMVNRFGARLMQALGCAIAAIAVGLSTLATELWHLYLAFGAVAGAGLSLVFTASSVIVEGHFERYLHIALPLSQLGDTVGYSVFPVLTQTLLNRIELRNTLLTFCGLTAVPMLLSVFYLPAVEQSGDEPEKQATHSVAPEIQTTIAGQPDSDSQAAAVVAAGTQCLTIEHSPVRIACNQAAQKEYGSVNPTYSVDGDAGGNGFMMKMERLTRNGQPVVKDHDGNEIVADTEKGRSVYGNGHNAGGGVDGNQGIGSVNQAYLFYGDQHSSCSDVATYNKCLTSNDMGTADSKAQASPGTNSTAAAASSASPSSLLSQWVRFKSLLTRGEVWLLLVAMFGWQYSSASIFVLLPSYVTRSGEINKDQAAIGLTLVGVANVVGNIVTVFAALRSYNRTLLYAASCLLFGAGVMLYTLTATNVAAYYSLSTFNGFWLGILLGLTMSVIFDFADAGGLTDLFGLVTFSSGLGGLAGPGITGVIQARVSDAAGIYVSGAASLLACATLVAPALKRHSISSKKKMPITA